VKSAARRKKSAKGRVEAEISPDVDQKKVTATSPMPTLNNTITRSLTKTEGGREGRVEGTVGGGGEVFRDEGEASRVD